MSIRLHLRGLARRRLAVAVLALLPMGAPRAGPTSEPTRAQTKLANELADELAERIFEALQNAEFPSYEAVYETRGKKNGLFVVTTKVQDPEELRDYVRVPDSARERGLACVAETVAGPRFHERLRKLQAHENWTRKPTSTSESVVRHSIEASETALTEVVREICKEGHPSSTAPDCRHVLANNVIVLVGEAPATRKVTVNVHHVPIQLDGARWSFKPDGHTRRLVALPNLYSLEELGCDQ
jgi:hypothetical protein